MLVLGYLSKSFLQLLVAYSPVYAGKKNQPYPVLNLNCHGRTKRTSSCSQVNDCKLSHCFRTHHTIVSH